MNGAVTGILAAALPWLAAIVMSVYVLRQFRRPSGPAGRLIAGTMNRSHGALTRWALERLSIAPDARILDVGCGGGQTVRTLASLAPQGTVAGVDHAPASVATARVVNSTLIEAGRVDIQQASVSALPFASETFDLAVAIETHYYWPDLLEDLREIRRVLKPGGRLTIVAESFDRGGASVLQRPVMAALRARFLTRAAHEDFFAQAGFVEVTAADDRARGWLCVTGTRPTAPRLSDRLGVLSPRGHSD